jgi:hypothetical protein
LAPADAPRDAADRDHPVIKGDVDPVRGNFSQLATAQNHTHGLEDDVE